MNVTYNVDTERVEWAPYRGDYGAHYSQDVIEAIEADSCVKGCTRSGTQADRDELGPGGNCHILALVALGEYGQVIPELEPRPDGPHCTAREDPTTVGIAHLFEFEETQPQTYPCAQPGGDCGCTGTGLLGCPGRSVEES